MTKFSFRTGVYIEINGICFCIRRIFDDDRVQLETEADGTLTNTTRATLLAQYESKNLSFITDLDKKSPKKLSDQDGRSLATFPESVQRKAIRKKQYLDYILNFGPFISTPAILNPLIAECAVKIADAKPPSPIAVYRWFQSLTAAQGDHRALIDRYDRRGPKRCRLHPEIQEMLQLAIQSTYLSQQRGYGTDVFFDLVHKINKSNEFRSGSEKLKIPSQSTVYRAIKNLDKFETASSRYSPQIARLKFRTSGRGPQPMRVLERVEIDHTPLDLFVFDQATNLPLGRPTVTLAIDVYSKMPVGMHVGFQGTSLESVYACIKHAMVPKGYIKDKYAEIEHDWPCHGKFENLVCDNGLEFHSGELERVAFEIGAQLIFCPKRQPYYKGTIERFLKTLNYQFAGSLPGRSFARWFQREDYDPQKHSVIPYSQLMAYLHRWIIDIYAQQLHRGINDTPYNKWNTGAQQHPPELIPDLRRLDVALGRTCQRMLGHYGIDLHKLRYNDPALLSIRRQHGERVKVEVRYYFGDLSYINVIDPITKATITVPAQEQEYTRDLSLVQHNLICAHVREVNSGKVNLAALARAKAEIRDIVHDMATSKSQRMRQKAARSRRIGTDEDDLIACHAPQMKVSQEKLAQLSADVSTDTLPQIGATRLNRVNPTPGENS